MIEFSYRKEKFSENEFIYRPVADVVMMTREGRVEIPRYIDSGADVSLIPFNFGVSLGLNQKEGEIREMKGVGGGIPFIYKKIKFMVKGREIKAKVAWALIEDVPALLGRKDIFDAFDINFKQREKKIIFEE